MRKPSGTILFTTPSGPEGGRFGETVVSVIRPCHSAVSFGIRSVGHVVGCAKDVNKNDPRTSFAHMLSTLQRAKGLVIGMFSEFSQDVDQLLKFCAGNIAERWAVLNGLPGEEALQCVTWQLNRRWSFTALRANARVRIECAHHVTYHQAGGGSGVAPRSVGRTHSGWLNRQRSM